MRPRPVPPPLRRPLAGLLVCALLLAQALGLLHRVQHADGAPTVHAQPALGTLEALFAQHHDAGDCQIFDQLSHADGVGFGFVEPGAMPPAQAPVAALQASKPAAQAAGYLARGPPRTA
jgi:hypothetical protein